MIATSIKTQLVELGAVMVTFISWSSLVILMDSVLELTVYVSVRVEGTFHKM